MDFDKIEEKNTSSDDNIKQVSIDINNSENVEIRRNIIRKPKFVILIAATNKWVIEKFNIML